MKRTLIMCLVLVVAAMATESKYICKAVHIGTSAIAVTCTNGADPTGNTTGNVLIISCAERKELK